MSKLTGQIAEDLLPEGVEQYWVNNLWDREIFEQSHLGHKFVNQRNLLLNSIKKYQPSKVLILCCGVGLETLDISKQSFVKEITAIDININSCNKTRARLGKTKTVKILNMNVYDIDYHNEFDSVVCMDALHHLGKQNLLLAKINKALKPGGVFIGDYFGKEEFVPWEIKKYGRLKYHIIDLKHHISDILMKVNMLPERWVKSGWIRTFLFTCEDVLARLQQSGFDVLELISDEWHFFVAQKPNE